MKLQYVSVAFTDCSVCIITIIIIKQIIKSIICAFKSYRKKQEEKFNWELFALSWQGNCSISAYQCIYYNSRSLFPIK